MFVNQLSYEMFRINAVIQIMQVIVTNALLIGSLFYYMLCKLVLELIKRFTILGLKYRPGFFLAHSVHVRPQLASYYTFTLLYRCMHDQFHMLVIGLLSRLVRKMDTSENLQTGVTCSAWLHAGLI